jgi:SAM-dependent methyltransferase
MRVKPYDQLSLVYDQLMKDVDYKSWSKYLLDLSEDYLTEDSKILELASGNCKMAEIISKRYRNYLASDKSYSMLTSAHNKSIPKICCEMEYLPFKEKFDFVYSAFDSINYILTKRKLFNLFREVYFVLNDNGIFTFDVSLENNSLRFQIAKTYEDSYNGYHFTRINKYNKRIRIHYNRFIISNNKGQKVKEVHKQKIFDVMTYFELADKSGLHIEACYDCFTFSDLNKDSERAQFVLRKRK